MQISNSDGLLRVSSDAYTLTFAADRPYVYLDDANGERIAQLFIASSVFSLNGLDDTTRIGEWQASEGANEIVCALHADSSLWLSKTYRFRCAPHRFAYEIEIEGEGYLTTANYFGGYYSAQTRWGSGWCWSGHHFKRAFNPEPNADEQIYFAPTSGSVIDLTGAPLPGKASWFFTPPPFCFAFETASGWMSMGVEAQPGANRFSDFQYHGGRGFYCSLAYDGHTKVSGSYTLPAIAFEFGASEYDVLESHCRRVRELNGFHSLSGLDKPLWWREPIWCGWGAQCYVEKVEHRFAYHFSRQDLYEQFLSALAANGVNPGSVVLDDKWQATYGANRSDEDKWHDLRGFVDAQHAQGRHVLLWIKAWSPEGLPPDECICNAAGLPIALDPTHPMLEKRLRASIRHMLSSEGYDADGFKIDFSARIPSGPGLRLHGDDWGLELLKRYLAIIYDELKRTKPDALMMTHTPHPYLADVLDMIRLNDINTGHAVVQTMTHRARVARAACPDALIDTDDWPMTDKSAWRAYTVAQPTLGVPSLYYATHIDTTCEPLTAEDYALIQETWAQYRKTLTREDAKGAWFS